MSSTYKTIARIVSTLVLSTVFLLSGLTVYGQAGPVSVPAPPSASVPILPAASSVATPVASSVPAPVPSSSSVPQPPAVPGEIQLDFSTVTATGSGVFNNAPHTGFSGLTFRDAASPNNPYADVAYISGYLPQGGDPEGELSPTAPTNAGSYLFVLRSTYNETNYPFPFSSIQNGRTPLGTTITYKTTPGGAGTVNYGFTMVYSFTIQPRAITITADNKEVPVYSNPNSSRELPPLTFTVSNLAPGHTQKDAFITLPTLTCTAQDTLDEGDFLIEVKDYTNLFPNYTAKAVNGVLSITKAGSTGSSSGLTLSLNTQLNRYFYHTYGTQFGGSFGTFTFPAATRGYTNVAALPVDFVYYEAHRNWNSYYTYPASYVVSISGASASAFTVSSYKRDDSQPNHGIGYLEDPIYTFDVKPKPGLPDGTYTARITIKASSLFNYFRYFGNSNNEANASASFQVSFTVGPVYAPEINTFGIYGGLRFTPYAPLATLGADGALATDEEGRRRGPLGAGGIGGAGGITGADGITAGTDGTSGAAGTGGALGTGTLNAASGAAGTGSNGSGTSGVTGGTGNAAGVGGAGGIIGGSPLHGLQVLNGAVASALTPAELSQNGLNNILKKGDTMAVLAEKDSLMLEGNSLSHSYDEEAGAYILTALAPGETMVGYVDSAGQSSRFPIKVEGNAENANLLGVSGAQFFSSKLATASVLGLCVGLPLLLFFLFARRRKKAKKVVEVEDEYWNW